MFQNSQINMNMRRVNIIGIASLFLSLFLTSCKVTEPYQRPNIPQEKLEHLYGKLRPSDSLSMSHLSLDKVFTDEHLQSIIQTTIRNNYDLKSAILRIQETDAYFKQSQLAFFPTLSGGPTVGINKISRATQPNAPSGVQQNYQLGVTSGWEIDIWGKLASAERGAYAALLASDASKRAIQTQLVAQAASLYYQLLAYDEQLRITNETIRLRKEQVETIKALKEAAITTGADVAQSEAALYEAQIYVPDLLMNIKNTENALALLMAETPHEIARGLLETQKVSTDLNTGVPSQLLTYRPDVQVAEYNFEKAFEMQNVAKADMLPSFNITAALGLASFKISDLFKESLVYSASGSLTQLIFGKGTKRTQLRVSNLQQQQAYLEYEKTVVQAGSEVANALNRYEAAIAKKSDRELQITSLERALDFNMELLKYSSKTTYTDVLSAMQSLLGAQLGSVNDRLQALQASVEFYRALGGGQY